MELNKSNMKKLILLILLGVVFFLALSNLNETIQYAKVLLGLISPFIMGLCIAFILNVPMRGVEKFLFDNKFAKGKKIEKIKRPISLVITLLLFVLVICLVLFLIVPEIGRTVDTIAKMLPGFFKNVQKWIQPMIEQLPSLQEFLAEVDIDWNKLSSSVINFFKNGAGDFFKSTVSIATSVFSGFFNFIMGFIFAIYVLSQKEKLTSQFGKVIKAYLPSAKGDFIIKVGAMANSTFSKFIRGQCLEAVILGALFFVTMSIFRFPYALMISVLITVTALIPIFGAFIGCFVGAFLIMVANPIQAIWFVVLFLVLQQLEGNLIYPRVVGTSVGLPSIWVLVAVTIGGSTMGVMGMLVGVPLASIAYSLLRESVNNRIAKAKKVA